MHELNDFIGKLIGDREVTREQITKGRSGVSGNHLCGRENCSIRSVPLTKRYRIVARGGLWDLQRIDGQFYPQFRDVSTIAIGLYGAAAGIPINDLPSVENTVEHSDPIKTPWILCGQTSLQEMWPNTKIGYDLYNSERIGNGH
jgi:hypothetical protein